MARSQLRGRHASGCVRIGDRQDPREHQVRRGVARMLANRLLTKPLRLIGDGEAALAIALL